MNEIYSSQDPHNDKQYRFYISVEKIRKASFKARPNKYLTYKNSTNKNIIPKRIWFTYKQDILSSKEPYFYYKNVMKTINIYRAFWKKPDAEAHVLDDKACIDILNEVDQELAHGFEKESNGAYKGDICRVGALYLYGGYYFDVDMEVVLPLKVPQEVTFATARDAECGYFFNSFMAFTPKHPILITYLDMLKAYYSKGDIGNCTDAVEENILGPCMLFNAYEETKKLKREKELLLQETPSNPNTWNDCGYEVFNPKDEETYFYSRIRGSSNCPFLLNPIPTTLWFIYESNFLIEKKPEKTYKNAKKIIDAYRKSWDDPFVQIRILDEETCLHVVEKVDLLLHQAYISEKNVRYKKEYCAIGILYLYGGYYFDTDMKMTSKPLKLKSEISFLSATYNETISTLFMASTPEHPVLQNYLKSLHSYFQGRIIDHCQKVEKNKLMGSYLLWEAYNEATQLERSKPFVVKLLDMKIDVNGYKYKLIDNDKGVSLFHYMAQNRKDSNIQRYLPH